MECRRRHVFVRAPEATSRIWSPRIGERRDAMLRDRGATSVDVIDFATDIDIHRVRPEFP